MSNDAHKHPNQRLLESFYQSFQKLEPQGMVKCYHPDAEFSDPVFPNLKGHQPGAMWTMLCQRAQDFELTFSHVHADDHTGTVQWEAKYVFSTTGRPIHNKIQAKFEFKDGKIIKHIDHFDFWKWSRMALGAPGTLLGWSPLIKNKVRNMASGNLEKFIEANRS